MSSASFFTKGPSDHSPVIVSVSENKKIGKPFRFFDFWVENEKFIPAVRQVWGQFVRGSLMFRVCRKLKDLKSPLKELNRREYSDISNRVATVRHNLEFVQKELDKNPRDVELQKKE